MNKRTERQRNERLGEENINNQNEHMKIIEYNNATDIVVQFDDGKTRKTTYRDFKSGGVRSAPYELKTEVYNKEGYLMKIIEYNSWSDFIVQFQDDYKYTFHCKCYTNFKKGEYKNPYHKSLYGVGMQGDISDIKNNNDYTLARRFWSSMIERCYSNKYQKCRKTYKECFVCDEWHIFRNFYDWFKNNYYEVNDEKMHLDKDILLKGNKIYCPECCCFVPIHLNELFTKSDAARGQYPIGVHYGTRDKVFIAQCCDGYKNHIRLGQFDNPTDAFYAYKQYKESVIRKMANVYKDKIPEKIYNALYKYEVEITD